MYVFARYAKPIVDFCYSLLVKLDLVSLTLKLLAHHLSNVLAYMHSVPQSTLAMGIPVPTADSLPLDGFMMSYNRKLSFHIHTFRYGLLESQIVITYT